MDVVVVVVFRAVLKVRLLVLRGLIMSLNFTFILGLLMSEIEG